MQYDVIIIGGSYAGMAAALQLVRARRQVLIIDAGKRRNRFATLSHGFLGQDGVDPALIFENSREQLLHYPSLRWHPGTAESVHGEKDAFRVHTQSGEGYETRRVLFAIGVKDILPQIEGLQQRWGQYVFHCPYCHGYELNQGKLAVIATGEMSAHQAQMVAEWGSLTFFTNSVLELSQEMRAGLHQRGVTIETMPVKRLVNDADIELADGRILPFAGIFIGPVNQPASDIAQALGCELEETPFGTQIRTDAVKETSVPGAFACGDAARVPHSVSLAVGDGAWAGATVHRSLIF
jgi:thioredoxin reductase